MWLDLVIVWPVLLYRFCKYGYTFRRIYLGEGYWTKLDQADYYRLRKYKWIVYGNGNSGQNLYAVRLKLDDTYKTTILSMHREIMNPQNGSILVDHRNCASLDNRRSNLRFATRSENMRNCRKRKNTTSQFIGVWFRKKYGKWESVISHNRKKTLLGRFENEVAAARAYDEAAKKYYGEFARLNFPPESVESRAIFARIGKSWAGLKRALAKI